MFSHRYVANRRVVITVILLGLLLLGAKVEKPWARATAQSFAPASPAPLPNTFGAQNTLVILVNFNDNSYQQTWLTGDVVGWYTVPLSYTVCDTTSLSAYANAAAAAGGADLTAYSRFVYVFPSNVCGFSGGTARGGDVPPHVYLNGTLALSVAAHEMGNAFGLDHAEALECGSATIGSNCSTVDYGDPFDMMAHATYAQHFNAYQKERLGWLGNGSSPQITTITSSGTYLIQALETLDGGAPKALKVLKSIDPTTGDSTWYYLEFRQPVGLDSSLSSNSNVINGLLVHQGTQYANSFNFFYSFLLDMTPETTSWYDSALPVGRTFTDTTAGVSITPQTVSSTGITVFIN